VLEKGTEEENRCWGDGNGKEGKIDRGKNTSKLGNKPMPLVEIRHSVAMHA